MLVLTIMKRILTLLLLFAALSSNAQNYLFIGIDSRSKELAGNADMIMIMTVHKENLKMASIMRDTYVNIPGHGMDKINASYRYGGAKLLISTINSNFKTKISSYIVVDFINAAKAVDMLGGLDMTVTDEERQQINNYVKEQVMYNNNKYVELTDTGNVKLNGDQVLAYTRIRHTAGGDRKRTERQRTVFNLIIKKMSSDKVSMGTLKSMFLLFNTNIDYHAAMETAGYVLLDPHHKWPETKAFPAEDYSKGWIKNGIWYLRADLPTMGKDINDYIKN